MNLFSDEEFERFRADMRLGRYADALERLWQCWSTSLEEWRDDSPGYMLNTLTSWLAEGFLQGPCLVLASQAHAGCQSFEKLASVIRETQGLVEDAETTGWPLLENVLLRCELVICWAGSGGLQHPAGPDDASVRLAPGLSDWLARLQDLGHSSEWVGEPSLASPDPPAIQWQLKDTAPSLALRLQQLAEQPNVCPLGWRDPALVSLAGLLSAVLTPAVPEIIDDRPGPTMAWIPLAVDDRTCVTPGQGGWFAQIEVRCLPGRGNGSLVPHLHRGSHLLTGRAFQRSLAQAWRVVLYSAPEWRQQDYEYRLSVADPSQDAVATWCGSTLENTNWQRQHFVGGRMDVEIGTLPIAASLRAAAAGDVLNPLILPVGRFGAAPNSIANPPLVPVDSLDGLRVSPVPALGLERARWLLTPPQRFLRGNRLELPPLRADTFDGAYESWAGDGVKKSE
ncbi:MAG: hypothetical protein ACKOGA_04765 [Planctomycetaceae bacterium]